MTEPQAASKSGPTGSAAMQSLFATLGKVPRVGLVSVLGPFLLLVVGYVLWISYGARHLDRTKYGLHEKNLIVTPQPDWIRSDVRKEVFAGSNLGQLNTLDRQLSEVVDKAFRVHPWIRKVIQIGKFTEQNVKVHVEYREPLAMIYEEASGQNQAATQSSKQFDGKTSSVGYAPSGKSEHPGNAAFHFFPVDVDGVLLPTKDFSPDEIPNYFLVYAQGSAPRGKKFGADYGDSRIKQALLLCRMLRDDRVPLGLEKIYVYPDTGESPANRCLLEITTKSGKQIHWGHAPGLEGPGEPGAVAKQRKLREILLNPNAPEAASMEIDLVEKAKAKLGEAFSNLFNR